MKSQALREIPVCIIGNGFWLLYRGVLKRFWYNGDNERMEKSMFPDVCL